MMVRLYHIYLKKNEMEFDYQSIRVCDEVVVEEKKFVHSPNIIHINETVLGLRWPSLEAPARKEGIGVVLLRKYLTREYTSEFSQNLLKNMSSTAMDDRKILSHKSEIGMRRLLVLPTHRMEARPVFVEFVCAAEKKISNLDCITLVDLRESTTVGVEGEPGTNNQNIEMLVSSCFDKLEYFTLACSVSYPDIRTFDVVKLAIAADGTCGMIVEGIGALDALEAEQQLQRVKISVTESSFGYNTGENYVIGIALANDPSFSLIEGRCECCAPRGTDDEEFSDYCHLSTTTATEVLGNVNGVVQESVFVDALDPLAMEMAITNLIHVGAVADNADAFKITTRGHVVKLVVEHWIGKIILKSHCQLWGEEVIHLAVVVERSSSKTRRVRSEEAKLSFDCLAAAARNLDFWFAGGVNKGCAPLGWELELSLEITTSVCFVGAEALTHMLQFNYAKFCHSNFDFYIFGVYERWELEPLEATDIWCWTNNIKAMKRWQIFCVARAWSEIDPWGQGSQKGGGIVMTLNGYLQRYGMKIEGIEVELVAGSNEKGIGIV